MSRETNILERHQTEGKIVVGSALLELEARLKNAYLLIDELREGMAGYAAYMEKMDERLKALEPVGLISAEEASKVNLGKLK